MALRRPSGLKIEYLDYAHISPSPLKIEDLNDTHDSTIRMNHDTSTAGTRLSSEPNGNERSRTVSITKIRSNFSLPDFLKEPLLFDGLKAMHFPENSPTGTLTFAAPPFAEAFLFRSAAMLKDRYNINLALLSNDSVTTVQGPSQGLVMTGMAQNDAEDDLVMLEGPPSPPVNADPEPSSNASQSAVGSFLGDYDMMDSSDLSPPMAGSSSSPPSSRPRREPKIPAKYKDSVMLLGKKSYDPLVKR